VYACIWNRPAVVADAIAADTTRHLLYSYSRILDSSRIQSYRLDFNPIETCDELDEFANLKCHTGDAENARHEIARHENAAPCCRGGKCGRKVGMCMPGLVYFNDLVL